MRRQGDAPTATNGEGVNEKAADDRAPDVSMLPRGWPWDEDVDPLQLKGWERRVYYAGWASGQADGLLRGRRIGWRERVEHEYRAWLPMQRAIRAAGGPFSLSFDELERRRAQLSEGYVPRAVPSYEQCMASWSQPLAVSA